MTAIDVATPGRPLWARTRLVISRTAAVLAAALALSGCSASGPCGGAGCGSGKVISQTRQVGGFTAIQLDSIGDLAVEQTGTDSLTVETDDNLQSIVTSTVKDGTLILAEHGCHNCSPTRIAFHATVSGLQKIELPSTGSVTASRLDGPALSIDLSGTGSIKLSGRVGSLRISLSGTGSCDASQLAAKSATVDLSGTGDVRVNASDTLEAKVSGTGSVRYSGSPKLTQSVSGTGSVHPE